MKTNYKYSVEITGARPVAVQTVYRASAFNAADHGLTLRAEPGAEAVVKSLATGRVLREYGTNERGMPYEK